MSEHQAEGLRTATGMRHAGAQRAAVVNRLIDSGFSEAAANAHADRIDAEMAVLTGARPVDMRNDIAENADQVRHEKIEATATPAPEYVVAARAHSANMMIAEGATANEVIAQLVADGIEPNQARRIAHQAQIDMDGAKELFEEMHDSAIQQCRTKLAFSVVGLGAVIVWVTLLLTGEAGLLDLRGRTLVFVIVGCVAAPVNLARAVTSWLGVKNATFAQYVSEGNRY